MCFANTTCLSHNESRINQSGNFGDIEAHEDEDMHFEPYFSAKYDIIGILMAFIIVLVNSWVFYLVAKNRSLRTPTNVFLIGLAATDLLNGLVCLPLSITCNIFQEPGLCFATIYILMFTSFLALSHILAVTADRFIAIICALRYQLIVTKRRSYIALAFVWLSSLLVSLMQLSYLRPKTYDPQENIPEEERQKEIAYLIACVVVYLTIPVLFMAFTYLMILREVRRQIRREIQNVPNAASAMETQQQQWRQRDGKAATIFFVMFFTHIVCWLPFFLLYFQQIFNSFFLPTWADYLFGYVRFVSSILNPCLYIFGKHDFRKACEMACKSRERGRAKSDLVIIMSSQV